MTTLSTASGKVTLGLLSAATGLVLAVAVITAAQGVGTTPAGAIVEGRASASLPGPNDAEMSPPAANLDAPVQVEVGDVGIAAAVEPLGLNPDGTMQVPVDYSKTGWFTGLEAPGQVGTSVIVGHYDSHTGPAVFFRLRELTPAQEIVVTLASGATKTFVVDRIAQYPKNKFPTIEVYGPSSESSLRLVTCGGSFDEKRRHYRDNVVVYATEKGL